jgi:poly-gamma-glutamate synthesis protein (capsule biosynthesis protein)
MDCSNRIIVTGDFCPINRIDNLIREGNYETIFNDFLPVLKDSCLALTNMECPITESGQPIDKIGPSLKASPHVAHALSFAGFNLLTLANNHIMDFGNKGLESTIRVCKENYIEWVGAGNSLKSARRIFYKSIGDHKVAVLNFAENEYSTTNGDYPGANPLDLIENYKDIREARKSADYVLVIVHGGHEMYNLPSPRIKKTFRFFADAGASAVIGHHTHCYSGYEVYRGTPIFYSLGNFIFDYPQRHGLDWNTGYAVEFEVKSKLEFRIIPYTQCTDVPAIRLMDPDAKTKFEEAIGRLNKVISDDNQLSVEFKKHCQKVKRLYLSFLEPHSVILLHYLRNHKLFPSLISKKKKLLFLNLIRCESHRDVIKILLGHKNA